MSGDGASLAPDQSARIGYNDCGSKMDDPVRRDQLKQREPVESKPPPAPLLWFLGAVAAALAVLPVIFARSPAPAQNKELIVLAASSTQSEQDNELTVFAAASLQNALDDINAAFTENTGVKVIAGYAASGALIKQIAQGAAADIFASADSE